MKKVVVTVTNDLSTDQRVQRAIGVWQELGYAPTFVGRELPESKPFKPNYATKRFKLFFTKGFLFYATYNLRLMAFLVRHRFDVYHANDLDSLLPNYLASRLFRKPLVYDSHEYFCGAPEIANRPLVKAIWLKLEKAIFPKLKTVITVNTSIARLYAKEYGKKITVVRNIGDSFLPPVLTRKELDLPSDKFILINQGAGINIDRGMEEMLAALPLLPADVVLLIVGKGDVLPQLKKQAAALSLDERVIFVPPQPYQKLLQYTLCADAGLSLDKDTNLNYRYSLPNKVFDYIKCGLPIVCSSVVEVSDLIKHYQIGEVTGHAPEQISQTVLKVREQGKAAYENKLDKAAAENNWEQERQVLLKTFTALD